MSPEAARSIGGNKNYYSEGKREMPLSPDYSCFSPDSEIIRRTGGMHPKVDEVLGYNTDYPHLSSQEIDYYINNGKADIIASQVGSCHKITDNNLINLIKKVSSKKLGSLLDFCKKRKGFFKQNGEIIAQRIIKAREINLIKKFVPHLKGLEEETQEKILNIYPRWRTLAKIEKIEGASGVFDRKK
ncbi:MAG: hypothetical protein N4A38_02560 [Candidatus Gracilibacteria bacterium]|nr:hypothetical protein [Candidatus Gracilibacteria bacterium]